jgi:hypothetical protein
MLKIRNLHWPLQAQMPIKSSELKCGYGLFSECFHPTMTVFRYCGYLQSQIFRKWQLILLRNIGIGMIWVRWCLNFWNHSYSMLVFYLEWFHPEMSWKNPVHFFLPPLYSLASRPNIWNRGSCSSRAR